jgi:hypothetical protein
MGKSKKLKYLSLDKNFMVFRKIVKIEHLDQNKRTKLWLSSKFLLKESFQEDPEKTKKILNDLIDWNKAQENYKECNELYFLLKECEISIKLNTR